MLTKYLMPIIAILAFGGGSLFGTKVLTKKCPDCKPEFHCPAIPEQKPCNGIDFDKIKSKYITIQNEQHLTVEGDSLFVKEVTEAVRAEIKAELAKLRLARCK